MISNFKFKDLWARKRRLELSKGLVDPKKLILGVSSNDGRIQMSR